MLRFFHPFSQTKDKKKSQHSGFKVRGTKHTLKKTNGSPITLYYVIQVGFCGKDCIEEIKKSGAQFWKLYTANSLFKIGSKDLAKFRSRSNAFS